MNVIDLKSLENGQAVQGLVLVQDHGKKLDTSNQPLKGTFIYKGKVVNFNVWSRTAQHIINVLNTYDVKGGILYIEGTYKVHEKYGESIDLLAVDFNPLEKFPNVTVADFLKSVDINTMSTELWNFLQQELEPNHFEAAKLIMNHEDTWSKFIMSYAGKKLHDAQVGGLMNHTFKMMKICKTLLQNDPRFQPYYSLMQLSLLVHDIGKIEELGFGGAYMEDTFVTHRIIGIEMMGELKKQLLQYMSLHDYRVLISILQGHHGEIDDKPRTTWALISHYIDNLEATTTSILDAIENGEIKENYGAKRVWVHGENLAI